MPEFLIPQKNNPHIGSIDVDLAFDHRNIQEDAYRTIQRLLSERGYEQGKQPYVFFREVEVEGQSIKVEVDLLSGEYGGTGKGHRHQRIQKIFARKARGCDLAFESPIEVTLQGKLPGGGEDVVKVRVASVISFLVMKGMAVDERLKEKDAWDIWYCLKNNPGGIDPLVADFRNHLDNALVKEGLEKIGKHFASEDHVGPKFVADFEEITDAEEREFIKRDVFERVDYLLKKLGIK